MDANWLSVDEFSKTVDMDKETIEAMIQRDELVTTKEDGRVFIDASSTNTEAILPEVMKGMDTGVAADVPPNKVYVPLFKANES